MTDFDLNFEKTKRWYVEARKKRRRTGAVSFIPARAAYDLVILSIQYIRYVSVVATMLSG